MCTGRIDPSFILRAFLNEVDGVFVGGCWLGECHYLTEGNHHAVSMMNITKKLMKQCGVNIDRLRLEWVSAAQGVRFAEVVTDFSQQIQKVGPIAINEAKEENRLKLKLKAAISIVPYVRLVERERLRVHFNTREEYDAFFNTEEVNRIFKEMVVDKLLMKQILMLLKEKEYTSEEIAGILGISTAEVSGFLMTASKKRLTEFDEHQKRFIPVTIEK
jgi:coenzyme F420-reducing hydrogenase delta subunit/predicted XRE-type DNA-binding protein